jgi:hypothetical protein
MKRIAFGVGAAVLFVALCAAAYLYYMSGAKNDPAFFESAIGAFEESDRESPPDPGGIVFVGSSSIRFWSTLEDDMAPLPVVNRGFGGAHFLHVVHNTDRIVLAYEPKAVVVYAGDNDIAAGTPVEAVVSGFQEFVARIHQQLPETEIYYLPIKPSKLRWTLWPKMQQANAQIETLTRHDARLHFIDVATPLLDADGEPRDDVFIVDGLHLNEKGYRAWTEAVAPVLRADWGRREE